MNHGVSGFLHETRAKTLAKSTAYETSPLASRAQRTTMNSSWFNMGRKMIKSEVESLSVRFTREIKRWVEREAANNFRSQSAQVLAILKERMEAEQADEVAG
jgi:hypothetical protein